MCLSRQAVFSLILHPPTLQRRTTWVLLRTINQKAFNCLGGVWRQPGARCSCSLYTRIKAAEELKQNKVRQRSCRHASFSTKSHATHRTPRRTLRNKLKMKEANAEDDNCHHTLLFDLRTVLDSTPPFRTQQAIQQQHSAWSDVSST